MLHVIVSQRLRYTFRRSNKEHYIYCYAQSVVVEIVMIIIYGNNYIVYCNM